MPIITKLVALPQITRRKRTAAYARVSSGKDAMRHSLSAQISYYSALIQRHIEWEFAGVYADDPVSVTGDNRKEFQRMLADCHAGKIDLIITKSITRFARNTLTTLETVRELKNLGIDVFFEKENIHSMSGDGELMLSILASYAQEESRSVSENCKWRIRKRFANGELVNLRFLYGYRIIKGKLEIDPAQAAVVINIFHHYIGGMGCMRIAKTLNALEVPSFSGKLWNMNQILFLLKNEKYTGNALLQKSLVVDHLTKRRAKNTGQLPKYYVEGTHLPIIDMDTFQRAQKVLAKRGEKYASNKTVTKTYAFSGCIQCGICGKNYRCKHAATGTKYEKIVWICTTFNAQGKAACSSQQIPENILMRKSAEILELSEFDETIFRNQISRIKIPGHNRLIFIFKDGREIEVIWKNRSRRESWTEEMRQVAREREFQRQQKILEERKCQNECCSK